MRKEIFLINPFRCRLWTLRDRFDNDISEESKTLDAIRATLSTVLM
jgi:hypothetical protein